MTTKEPAPSERAPVTAQEPPRHSRMWLAILIAVICLAGVVWLVKHRQAQAAAKAARAPRDVSAPVVVTRVERKTLPIYLDGLGTVQAFNTVTVKSRVDGQLIKVAFTEGQDVRVGDLLGLIDAAPFQTAFEQAQAKKAQDEAQLANARIDLERDQQLSKDKIVTEQALATQQALVAGLDAAVKADQAAIDSAKVQVDYATIRSPLDGRCGIRLIDQGNIVHTTDTNGLVVITQLKPISVIFTLPEQYISEISSRFAKGPLKVEALDRDNRTTLGMGTLTVIDNQIDTSTGTIRMKATFPNEDLRLWPGQFINARLIEDQRTGLVVPAAVIQRGPTNEYAFLVVSNVARVQPLKVVRMEGGRALIDNLEGQEGLHEGDIVVEDGQVRLQEGTKVTYGPAQGGNGGKGGGKQGGQGPGGGTNRMTNE